MSLQCTLVRGGWNSPEPCLIAFVKISWLPISIISIARDMPIGHLNVETQSITESVRLSMTRCTAVANQASRAFSSWSASNRKTTNVRPVAVPYQDPSSFWRALPENSDPAIAKTSAAQSCAFLSFWNPSQKLRDSKLTMSIERTDVLILSYKDMASTVSCGSTVL